MCTKCPYTCHDTSDATEFSKLICEVRKEFETTDRINVDRIKSILAGYKSNRIEWEKYTTWDHHRYTRNLVDEGNGKYNMMILCWGESQVSPVHSHPDSNCFVKLLSGVMQETIFALPSTEPGSGSKKLVVKGEQQLKKDEVSYIHDSIGLHAMENPSHTEGAVTLHLYVPPYMECDVYDIRTGKISTSSMTFTTKGGLPVVT
ncbi:Cysteine dioxygenase type 1-like [Oopsacas minuta]|uniref:Cysteine dioxygenase n=1 Tax=Oopsacas minuta TaxID=111878 RepID=A0AAV7KQR7_9METZ|nr:Cysteine dioxygenase type 1-like [Oopsacas minuta]